MYFKMPFISDNVNHKVVKAFKSEGINVRICHQSFTLRQALRPKNPFPTSCALLNCPLKDPRKCYQRKVVYEIKCNKCHSTYIGSTIRQLHLRVKEHNTNSSSSVFQHLRKCQSGFTTTVLSRDHDMANLRIREGLYIRKLNPAINSRLEAEEMADFLF